MSLLRTGALLGLAIASLALPVFRLPRPGGPYAVGTAMLPGAGAAAQIWYPAAAAGGRAGAYAPADGSLERRLLRRVRGWAVADAPVAAGRFPVVAYVNGWGGTRWENTGLLVELASRGYLVAAADQPGGAALNAPMDGSSAAAWADTERRAAIKLEAQVAGVRALLDRLAALDAGPGAWTGRLDLTRIGLVGFSFGGATAAEAAVADRRVGAVVNLDGLLFGAARRQGVAAPYLELSDDETVGPAPAGADAAARLAAEVQMRADAADRANLARHGGTLLTIAGTLHSNFSDGPVLVPVRRLNGAGPIDPRLAARIVAVAVAGFLDHVMKGAALPELGGFKAVRLERWPGSPAAGAGAPR